MYTIVQFSPTGNSAYAAELLADALKVDKVYALEHIEPKTLEDDHHLILFYAIHAFNAPRTVKRFIKDLPANKYEHISLIAVGCNTGWVNGAASKNIRKQLEKKSYSIAVNQVIAMPLTLVMSFPESIIHEQIHDLKASIKTIATEIKEAINRERTIPLKAHVIHSVGYLESFAARFFGLELHAKKSCIKCGLCVRECPEKNIRMTEKRKIKFGFKCMMCMRCIYNCPTKSITPWISKFIPIKGGYSIERYLENESVEK